MIVGYTLDQKVVFIKLEQRQNPVGKQIGIDYLLKSSYQATTFQAQRIQDLLKTYEGDKNETVWKELMDTNSFLIASINFLYSLRSWHILVTLKDGNLIMLSIADLKMQHVFDSGIGEVHAVAIQGMTVTLAGKRKLSMLKFLDAKPKYSICEVGMSTMNSVAFDQSPSTIVYAGTDTNEIFALDTKDAFKTGIPSCRCIFKKFL